MESRRELCTTGLLPAFKHYGILLPHAIRFHMSTVALADHRAGFPAPKALGDSHFHEDDIMHTNELYTICSSLLFQGPSKTGSSCCVSTRIPAIWSSLRPTWLHTLSQILVHKLPVTESLGERSLRVVSRTTVHFEYVYNNGGTDGALRLIFEKTATIICGSHRSMKASVVPEQRLPMYARFQTLTA